MGKQVKMDNSGVLKTARTSKGLFPLEKEYVRTVVALNQTGVVSSLPRSKKVGVVGIDGKEYPVPTQKQVQAVLIQNKKLVERKLQQGFTQLQLTPLVMPLANLLERVKSTILQHAAGGKIIQTQPQITNGDFPVQVNLSNPIWIWERVRQAVDTPALVYFPQTYADYGHQGLSKKEVITKTDLCAVPGWSLGLIEPIPIMPQQGQGTIVGGRKQLEGNATPIDYLRTLGTPPYEGETGWTFEDFLTHFVTRLETTNQVSHDRDHSNALWLLGSFIPNLGGNRFKRLVATGYWGRKRLYLSVHRAANRLKVSVARSMVRLRA